MRLPPTDTHAPALPKPDEKERARSTELAALMRAEIERAGGAMPFSRFMELALYAPGLGYYSAGQGAPGAQGDFVTAPEIGNLFARCVTRACVPILRATSGSVFEAGAGSGRLCADVLLELARLECLPRRYFILELSSALRAGQQATIARLAPHLRERVVWLDRLPERFEGVALANELLDAMPVELVRLDDGRVLRMTVGMERDEFVWRAADAPDDLAATVHARLAADRLPRPYTSEINLNAEGWIRAAGDWLATGVLFIFDYGFPRAEYYHPDRAHGTLMCHYRQRAHDDPLRLPGLQDITAHVDFTAVAEAGHEGGLEVLGYAPLGAFLLGAGITELAAESRDDDARASLALAAEIKKLTLPHEMGELFKVIALGRGIAEPMTAFRFARRGL
jgi:SAM-dependent MidA family methyltransferase